MPTRVAVVGGGTAGFMAAAHLSRHFPDLELVLVLDPRIPIIGVGEGTTPGFRLWLDDLARVPYEDMRRDIRVTLKRGVRFENWGRVNRSFDHDFIPTQNTGLHLSAPLLVDFLRKYVRGEIIEAHVLGIDGHASGASVRLENRPALEADVVIEARGFPRALGEEHIPLTWIPTNAALVTRVPRVSGLEWTRSVARPHGWVFIISLTEDTAYGYIYGKDLASEDEVMADFAAFLAEEGFAQFPAPRPLAFPNFLCKQPFRDRVLKIGNCASFIEPLEATAIAANRYELNFLTVWLRAFEAGARGAFANPLEEGLNRQIHDLVMEISLFVGWHYAEGSCFDTRFWREAKARFERGLNEGVPAAMRARFFDQLAHASRVRHVGIASLVTHQDFDRLVPEHRAFPPPFGGMTPLGFVQVARGIGYAM
jgi:tryptophan halogenase